MGERRFLTVTLQRGPALVTVRREIDGARIEARGIAGVRTRLEATIDAFAAQRGSWADGFAVDGPWCALTLRSTDDGFVVQSPRFVDDPHEHRTDDLSIALTIADGWERVRRRADVEPRPVRFDDTMLAVTGWEQHSMLTMTRVETADPGDSGWLVEPHESEAGTWDAAHRERLQAWMVQSLRPAVIRAAVLPPGLAAVVQDDDIRVIVREADRAVHAHGLL